MLAVIRRALGQVCLSPLRSVNYYNVIQTPQLAVRRLSTVVVTAPEATFADSLPNQIVHDSVTASLVGNNALGVSPALLTGVYLSSV